jgi:hypothetical protein
MPAACGGLGLARSSRAMSTLPSSECAIRAWQRGMRQGRGKPGPGRYARRQVDNVRLFCPGGGGDLEVVCLLLAVRGRRGHSSAMSMNLWVDGDSPRYCHVQSFRLWLVRSRRRLYSLYGKSERVHNSASALCSARSLKVKLKSTLELYLVPPPVLANRR